MSSLRRIWKGSKIAFAQLDAEGFCVNASPMIQPGLYLSRNERTDPELDLLVRYNTPLDLHFKLQPHTKGRPCFYPAMTYYIRYDGMIRIGCIGPLPEPVHRGNSEAGPDRGALSPAAMRGLHG